MRRNRRHGKVAVLYRFWEEEASPRSKDGKDTKDLKDGQRVSHRVSLASLLSLVSLIAPPPRLAVPS